MGWDFMIACVTDYDIWRRYQLMIQDSSMLFVYFHREANLSLYFRTCVPALR